MKVWTMVIEGDSYVDVIVRTTQEGLIESLRSEYRADDEFDLFDPEVEQRQLDAMSDCDFRGTLAEYCVYTTINDHELEV